jgi:hypothetical protein
MARWLGEAGFLNVTVNELPRPNPHSVIVGIKP